MNRISIKLRVTLWYTVILAVISAVTIFAAMTVSQQIFMRDSSERVIRTVNDFSRMMNKPQGDFRKMPGFRFFEEGVHVAVYNEERKMIGGFMPFAFADEISFEEEKVYEKEYDGETFLSYAKETVDREGQKIWVVGMISVDGEKRMLRSVTQTNLILAGVLILAAAIGGYWMIKKALRPVDRIGKTAQEISQSRDLSRRIGLGDGKDEIYRLANTFDEMLDKIEMAMKKEKQFTDDASHELRTPVAVIASECEYITDCVHHIDEAKESVDSIKRQADKMTKLIEELLTISRMDRDTLQLQVEEVDVGELLNFVCDEQEELHEGQKIRLEREIADGVMARADRMLLTRLFINLISNAYTYSKGEGHIVVSMEEKGEGLQVRIADDGIGIGAEHLPHIWERFYQVDPSRSGQGNNIGLGLSMARWIAESHQGVLAVESQEGFGTTFLFTMPRK